jgi:hypothetical protein
MRMGSVVHWLAIRIFIVAAAAMGVWLFVTGVVATTPPSAGSVPVADSVAPRPSSTELTISPAPSVAQGTAVTLSATISHPTAAGTVQFKDGAMNVGAPVRVNNGSASQTTSILAAGSHRLIAVFTPTDAMALGPSTSPARMLMVTGPYANGPLPATAPHQSGLSLDSPAPTALDDQAPAVLDSRMPTALDNQAPVAVDLRVPTVLDNRAPTALNIQAPTLLDNQTASVLNVRVPTLLDNPAPSLLDVRLPGVVNLRVPTMSDNRMPSDLDGQQRTSRGNACSTASSATCSSKQHTNRSITSCQHHKCGSRSKCASPNTMTSETQQQSTQGQSTQGQTTQEQNTQGQTTQGQTTQEQNTQGQNNPGR